MRTAVHHDALKEILNGSCDYILSSTILSSKIAVTSAVLANYESHLGTDQKFQAWFTAAAQGRLSLHLPQSTPSKVQQAEATTQGYATAAYYGGSTIVANSALPLPITTALAGIGTRFISTRSKLPRQLHGDNPILTISTVADGDLDFSVLDNMLVPEDTITIYDKYINSKSIELLEYIAKKLPDQASIKILHTFQTGRNLIDSQDIRTRLQQSNSNINIEVKKCSSDFKKLEHDRYIFLGNRIQIVFSGGLDCFGVIDQATGKRKNKRSKINYYDVTEGEDLILEADDGTTTTVKSIGLL